MSTLDPNTSSKSRGWIIAGCVVVCVVASATACVMLIRAHAAKSTYWLIMLNRSAPWLVPSESIAKNLERDTGEPLYSSLGILGRRGYEGAKLRARELLKSDDAYAWLNAAHYLGAVGDERAVPYLIKALRHSAYRSDGERVALLQKLTGKSFGKSFKEWRAWWEAKHPEANFDWRSSLGSEPRVRD